MARDARKTTSGPKRIRLCGRHWGKDGLGQYGDPDVETKRACCHGGPESKKTTCRRKASGLIWNPRSI